MLDSIPVSIVDKKWMKQFLNDIKNAIHRLKDGGVICLAVDAVDEGNYLLRYLRLFLESDEIIFDDVQIDQSDPFLFWNDFVGTGDQVGKIASLAEINVISIFNGCYLPPKFIKDRIKILIGLCNPYKIILIIPIFHEDLYHEKFDNKIIIPQFETAPIKKKKEIIHDILKEADPSLDNTTLTNIVHSILEANPHSRTELQKWIDHYDTFEEQIEFPPKGIMRIFRSATHIDTVNEIHARFISLEEKLKKISENHYQWLGRPLFRQIHDLPEPFVVDEPAYWFSATVSYLSCFLFDSADKSLSILITYNCEAEQLFASHEHHFFNLLRNIRTIMQHGLRIHSNKNRRTIEFVENWFVSNCQKTKPQKQHWRKLTIKLLDECEDFINRLFRCMNMIPDYSEANIIKLQLDRQHKELKRHEWIDMIHNAVMNINPCLSPNKLYDKYTGRIQKELKDSIISDAHLLEEAKKIAENIIIEESSKFPVQAKDFEQMGIEKGPKMGQYLKQSKEIWKQNSIITKEELLKRVMDQTNNSSEKNN